MGGNSTIVSASRRLTLRAGGHQGSMGQKGDPWELKEESGHPGSTIQPERRGVSTVELGDWGVKVRLFVKVDRYSWCYDHISVGCGRCLSFRVPPRDRKRVRE